MINYLSELLSLFMSYCPSFAINYFPLWKILGWKRRRAFAFFAGLAAYLTVCHFIARLLLGELDTQALYATKTIATVPPLALSVWLFRRWIWQNIFLIVLTYMYAMVSSGNGTYLAERFFPAAAFPRLVECIFILCVTLPTLPPLLYLLKRLFSHSLVQQAVAFLRLIWILPAAFIIITMTEGNYLSSAEKGIGFLLLRVLTYAVLLLVIYLLDSVIRQVSENAVLKEQARLIEIQLDSQREQYRRIAQSIEQIKIMRHDIRHQLAAIGQLAGEVKVKGYIGELIGAIPETPENEYCVNYAVNAVVAHYISGAAQDGIQTDIRLDIPEQAGCVSDMDLCVVMGNLLENALDACRRVERGERFIRVRANIDGVYLSMMVENSFNGIWSERGGVYLSMKRVGGEAEQQGIGLSSVKAVCAKYGGLAKVEIARNIWRTAALVNTKKNIAV